MAFRGWNTKSRRRILRSSWGIYRGSLSQAQCSKLSTSIYKSCLLNRMSLDYSWLSWYWTLISTRWLKMLLLDSVISVRALMRLEFFHVCVGLKLLKLMHNPLLVSVLWKWSHFPVNVFPFIKNGSLKEQSMNSLSNKPLFLTKLLSIVTPKTKAPSMSNSHPLPSLVLFILG